MSQFGIRGNGRLKEMEREIEMKRLKKELANTKLLVRSLIDIIKTSFPKNKILQKQLSEIEAKTAPPKTPQPVPVPVAAPVPKVKAIVQAVSSAPKAEPLETRSVPLPKAKKPITQAKKPITPAKKPKSKSKGLRRWGERLGLVSKKAKPTKEKKKVPAAERAPKPETIKKEKAVAPVAPVAASRGEKKEAKSKPKPMELKDNPYGDLSTFPDPLIEEEEEKPDMKDGYAAGEVVAKDSPYGDLYKDMDVAHMEKGCPYTEAGSPYAIMDQSSVEIKTEAEDKKKTERKRDLQKEAKIREAALKSGDWNARFQAIEDSNEDGRIVAMSSLIQEFWKEAVPVARTIIEEFAVPAARKTYKPFGAGGLAGGEKYKVGSLFFKFANDWQGIYKAHEFAIKAANREMLGLRAYLKLHLKGLHFPVVILVDHLGHRLICSSLLPLSKTTLVYGSDDQGRTVQMSDPECNDLMENAGRELNLKGHKVAGKTIFSCGDVEVHRGLDGRLYLLDTARVFPPEAPSPMISVLVVPVVKKRTKYERYVEESEWRIVDADKRMLQKNIAILLGLPSDDRLKGIKCGAFMAYVDTNATEINIRASKATYKLLRGKVLLVPRTESLHLFEMLRPELVKASPMPLSSDAWSRFGLHNHQEHNVEVQQVSSTLPIKLIAQFVDRCLKDIPTSQEQLIDRIHSMGLNCRHLGRLRSAVYARLPLLKRDSKIEIDRLNFTGQFLLTQMVSRVFKSLIRRQLRDIKTSEYSKVVHCIVHMLNDAIGGADLLEKDDLLKIRLQMKYGMRTSVFTAEEMRPNYILIQKISRMSLLRTVALSLGVRIKLEKLIWVSSSLDLGIAKKLRMLKNNREVKLPVEIIHPLTAHDIVTVEPVFRSIIDENEKFGKAYGRTSCQAEAKLIIHQAKNDSTADPLRRFVKRQKLLLPELEAIHTRTINLAGPKSLEAALSHIRVARCLATLSFHLRSQNADWEEIASKAVKRVRDGLAACPTSNMDMKDSKLKAKSYPISVLVSAEIALGLVAMARDDIENACKVLRDAFNNLIVCFDDLPAPHERNNTYVNRDEHEQLGGLCPAMIRVGAVLAKALLIRQSDPMTPRLQKTTKEAIALRWIRSQTMYPCPAFGEALVLSMEEACLLPGTLDVVGFESERRVLNMRSDNNKLVSLLASWWRKNSKAVHDASMGGTFRPSGDMKVDPQTPEEELAGWLSKLDMTDYISGLEGFLPSDLLESVPIEWIPTPTETTTSSESKLSMLSIKQQNELWFWSTEHPASRCLFTDRYEGPESKVIHGAGVVSVGYNEFGILVARDDGAVYQGGTLAGTKADKGAVAAKYQDEYDWEIVRFHYGVKTLARMTSMSMHRVIEVSVGRNHAALRTMRGMVFTFGGGKQGQLGHGNGLDNTTPRWVEALRTHSIAQISCGNEFTLCRTMQGVVWGFGQNSEKQLGCSVEGQTISLFPVKARYPKAIRHLCSGTTYHVAISQEGILYWGGDLGQFAYLASGYNCEHPVAILTTTRFTTASCAEGHGAAVDIFGRLFTWGRNHSSSRDCAATGQINGGKMLWVPPTEVLIRRGARNYDRIESCTVGSNCTMAISATDGLLFGCGTPLPYYQREYIVSKGKVLIFEKPVMDKKWRDRVIGEYQTGEKITSFEEFVGYIPHEREPKKYIANRCEWLRSSRGWFVWDSSRVPRFLDFPFYNLGESLVGGSQAVVPLLPPSTCSMVSTHKEGHILAVLSPSVAIPKKLEYPEAKIMESPVYFEIIEGKKGELPPEDERKDFEPYLLLKTTKLYACGSTIKVKLVLPHYTSEKIDRIFLLSRSYSSRRKWKSEKIIDLEGGITEKTVEIELPKKPFPMVLIYRCGFGSRSYRDGESLMEVDSDVHRSGMLHIRYFGTMKDYASIREAKRQKEEMKKSIELAKLKAKEERKKIREETKAKVKLMREKMKKGEKPPGGWKASLKEGSKPAPEGTVAKPKEEGVIGEINAFFEDAMSKLKESYIEAEATLASFEETLKSNPTGPTAEVLKEESRTLQTEVYNNMGQIVSSTMQQGGQKLSQWIAQAPMELRSSLGGIYSGQARSIASEYQEMIQNFQPRMQEISKKVYALKS
ncbi:hypothetical protein AAMO2058_001115800 [Amorphochlora amoebiformis]